MVILTTERLSIEEAKVEDTSFFFELLNSSNWIEYIGDRGIKTEADALGYIKNSLIKSYRENGYGLYKIILKEAAKPIGLCGFLKREYLDHEDIGFAILPQYERKGYMYEASDAMMRYGKSELEFNTIYAITTAKNLGSQNLLVRLGLNHIKDITSDKNESLMLFST